MGNKKTRIDYAEEYEKSLRTLEDLQRLSEFSLSPIISQIYFHLTEMKRKADANRLTLVNPFETINKVLDEKFQTIICDYFGNKVKFKNYVYQKNIEKIDLKKWNLILEVIPEFLSVVSFFNFHGTVEVIVNEKSINLSGIILEDSQAEHSRKFIYMLTRKLLKQKTLLVFKLNQTERSGLFKLDLKLDLSSDEEWIYQTKFQPNDYENFLLGFPNLFYDYRSSLEATAYSGEHNIIEIHNDFSVKHHFGIVDSSSFDSGNKEILHFPFIFRPVSIILPIKGSLVKESSARNLAGHLDETNREQDVSNRFEKFDFFSLFQI